MISHTFRPILFSSLRPNPIRTEMVEVTYQMFLSTLQTIALIVGIYYYIMTLRNQSINRQAQLFMNLYSLQVAPEIQGLFRDSFSIEMNGVDDWNRLQEDREQFKSWAFFATYFEGMGVLVREGLIDIGLVAKMVSGNVIWFWEKYRDGILELRKDFTWPRFCREIEYLYDRLIEYSEKYPELKIHSPTM